MSSYMRSINRIARCGVLYREERFKQYGLNGHQHVYLYNIKNNPGISQEQLSKKILVNKSNVARQTSVLEKNGFIERKVSNTDKRQFKLYPTEKTLALLPEISGVIVKWNNLLLEDFSEEEKILLETILEKIMERAVSIVSSDVFEPGEII